LIPEIKIFLYIFFVICLFFIKDLTVYAVIFIVILPLLFRIPFKSLKSGWIPISLFLLFTFVSNALFQPGRILFGSGPLVITAEGLDIASVRTLRVLFMIAGAKILTSTTEFGMLANALERIFSPLERLGVPVHEFFSAMGLTMRSLPALKEQMVREYREKVKGGDIRGFLNRARAISMFLIPLFVRSMQSPESFFDDEAGDERKN
jgi:energy-coupling factor transport system permease protein